MPANPSFKKFLSNLLKVLIIFLLSGLILFGLFQFNEYFKIKEIKIIGSQSNMFGLEEINDQNLLFISNKQIEKIITEKNPLIKIVLIKKKYPSTLEIKFSFFKPVAELSVSNGFYGLADNGKIVYKSKKRNSELTNIKFYQKLNYQAYNQGETVSFKEILDGLFFLKKLTDLNIKAESLDINGINMLVFNLRDKKIIFSSEKEKEAQTFQLGEIIKQFKIKGKQYREIDLRYDKPVIRF